MRARTSWPPLGVVVGEPCRRWTSDTRSPSRRETCGYIAIFETGTILDMRIDWSSVVTRIVGNTPVILPVSWTNIVASRDRCGAWCYYASAHPASWPPIAPARLQQTHTRFEWREAVWHSDGVRDGRAVLDCSRPHEESQCHDDGFSIPHFHGDRTAVGLGATP